MQLKDEIDFNEVLKQPIRLFGIIFPYFLAVCVAIGIYYVKNINNVSRTSIAPVIILDSTSFVKDIPMVRSSVILPVDVMKAGKTSKELVDKGAALFKANCVSCHGNNGMGDGPTSLTLNPKPRNFHAKDGWTNGRKISQMYKTLQEGIVKNGMASYNYMPAEDRFALLHFVRTFAADFPVDSAAELMELEKTYQLSKGSVTSAQIPVKLAMQKIAQEVQPAVESIGKKISAVTNGAPERGEQIFVRVARDQKKVFASILSPIVRGKNIDEFVKIVSSDPLNIGFKAEVLRLNAEEWNALYAYLSKVGA